MAATPFDASLHPSNSFLFDIYNDGQPAAHSNAPAPAPVLPGGPCNYTDLNLPRCGCRRFWSRPLTVRGVYQDNNLNEICMCSHHACFHEDVAPAQPIPGPGQIEAQSAGPANAAGQENEKPRLNREPLSPVQDLDLPSFHLQSNLGSSLDFNLLNFQSSMANQQLDGAIPNHTQDPVFAQESPMPDTLNWRDLNLVHSQGNGGSTSGLPPIPHQCLMPSQYPPSTASSSQTRYLRPFAGKGLQTLSGVPGFPQLLPRERSSDATAVELPHEALGADGQVLKDLTPRDNATTPESDPPQGLVESQYMQMSGPSRSTLQELSTTVQGHEQRINQLETTSFSVAGHEECHEKHDHLDLRVTELETRVDEVEKLMNNDNSTIGSSRRLRHDNVDDSTASVVSVSTDATARISSRTEIYSQIQALQEQVNQLQAASLPTYTQPWELEVVFLPFPLKGVWLDGKEFPSQRQSTGNDEWTQMPNTASRATPDPQTPHFGEWVPQNRESRWLLPRAFANGRAIDQRLKSRGFIKAVVVRGSDARSIQLAINNAFGGILRVSAGSQARSGFAIANSPLAEFLGLRQAWVPLRKLHKDSRLRFLAPAEMATPALWDYTFLVSSVVMKATGTNRLYVTQPEAYLQDHPLGYHAAESGWTWQKLRELSRIYPDSQSSSGDVPEGDAMEDYWAWNDRLDEPPAANVSSSTLSLHTAQQFKQSRRSSTSPSQQFFTGMQSPILSNSPRALRARSPLISRDKKAPRPSHIRTNSLPQQAAPILPVPSPSQSRRRVSSYNTNVKAPVINERRPSPFIPRPKSRASPRPQTTISAMRRLGTRSPSVNHARNTPGWSRTSMSRSPGPLGYFDDRRSEMRTTPFFYATPHSNATADPPNAYRASSSRAESHGPPVITRNGYDPDDDEDMDADYENDDRGSSTDSDSAHVGLGRGLGGTFDNDDDEDMFIGIYEDADELDDVDTDGGHGHGQVRPEDIPRAGIEDHMSDGENVDPHETQSISQNQSQEIEIHEDEPLELEDEAASGDSVKDDYDSLDVDIIDHSPVDENGYSIGSGQKRNDAASDTSSQPSEYPSTHPVSNLNDATMTSGGEPQGGQALAGNSIGRRRAVSVYMTGTDDLFHIHEDAPRNNGDGSSHGGSFMGFESQ